MDSRANECPIVATAAAKHALDLMRDRYGDIILHVTGGFAKTPLCISAGDLRIGPRDIHGVRVYEMQITPEIRYHRDEYVLDVIEGVPVGFSLDPGNGTRFTIERRARRDGNAIDDGVPAG